MFEYVFSKESGAGLWIDNLRPAKAAILDGDNAPGGQVALNSGHALERERHIPTGAHIRQ